MGQIHFDLKGIVPLKRKLNGQFANVRDGTLAAVHKPIKMIMQESLRQVPKDTNALANSAYEEPPAFDGNGVTISFGYGGSNAQVNPRTGQSTTDYAWIVHERLDTVHPIGKAKYLEDPINDIAPNILHMIGNDLSRFFR